MITGRGRPRIVAAILPDRPDRSYFWPGAARAEGAHVWVLAQRVIHMGCGVWDFRVVGTWLARLDVADWRVDVLRPVAGGSDRVSWSGALLDRGAYTYIYGVEMSGLSSWVHIARVPRGRLESPWSFYGGSGWTRDHRASARVLAGVTSISVLDLGRRGLRLITQQGLGGREVYSWRAAGPVGPFSGRQTIYDTGSFGERTYTYNAVAHPQHAAGNGMLFSFNVNSFNPLTPSTASLYRPRFFRVALGAL